VRTDLRPCMLARCVYVARARLPLFVPESVESTTQVTNLLSVNFSAPSGSHSIRWVAGRSDVHVFEQLHATPLIPLSHSGAFLYLFSFFLHFRIPRAC
jgi:hypothetical protein